MSWDDVNAASKLKFITIASPDHADYSFMYGQVMRYLGKYQSCSRWQPRTTPCGLCWLQQWSPLKYALGCVSRHNPLTFGHPALPGLSHILPGLSCISLLP